MADDKPLTKKKCVPCEGGVPKLGPAEIARLGGMVRGWDARDDRLRKVFDFKTFVDAMAFVNKMAGVAEEEGHHPDFCVHYNRVIVFLWTHAIKGLSENDFILAAKLDEIG
jgi:4a-hydroxytetrahydrobiopterin dehydratase